MSQEVDERVVEMRFDNAQFEKNVRQTMQSIEKLNDSLRLDGAEKGFEKISDASSKVDFDEMQGALDNLSGKFSAVEVMGVAALSHITRQAVNTGEKTGKEPFPRSGDERLEQVCSEDRQRADNHERNG